MFGGLSAGLGVLLVCWGLEVLALECPTAVRAHQICWSTASGSVSSPRNVICGYQSCSHLHLKHGEWGELEESVTVGLNGLGNLLQPWRFYNPVISKPGFVLS